MHQTNHRGVSTVKKLTSLLAIASFAIALTGASALACEKTCSSSKTTAKTTNASAKLTCSSDKSDSKVTTASADNCNPDHCALATGKYAVAVMDVDGMTCGGCENKLTLAFEKADGVLWVAAVSHSDGMAKVVFDKSITSSNDMITLVNGSGFKAEIKPAVAVSTVDAESGAKLVDSKAGCTDAQKAACKAAGKATCSAEQKAACEASGKACCADKGAKGASKASVTTASASQCDKSGNNDCKALTAAEKAAFCAEFCKSESKDSKKDI
jgi:copper chaperone CopZ